MSGSQPHRIVRTGRTAAQKAQAKSWNRANGPYEPKPQPPKVSWWADNPPREGFTKLGEASIGRERTVFIKGEQI
jgi:hypothetical protein